MIAWLKRRRQRRESIKICMAMYGWSREAATHAVDVWGWQFTLGDP